MNDSYSDSSDNSTDDSGNIDTTLPLNTQELSATVTGNTFTGGDEGWQLNMGNVTYEAARSQALLTFRPQPPTPGLFGKPADWSPSTDWRSI